MRQTNMETTAGILEQLRLLKIETDQPMGLYHICIPLIGAGYTHDQLLNAMFLSKAPSILDCCRKRDERYDSFLKRNSSG